jgi:hypothetical protein
MKQILPNYRNFKSFMEDKSPFATRLRGKKNFDLNQLGNFFSIYGQ